MRTTKSNVEVRRQNLIKIARYIQQHEKVSRQELSVALGFSLPTVFQNVTELMDWGLVCEAGEYGSTGGRKAKVLQINEGFRCVVGMQITKEYVYFVLMDLSQKVLDIQHEYLPYENTQRYYIMLGDLAQRFVKNHSTGSGKSGRLIGVGLALPGIIDHSLGLLCQSAALGVTNIGIRLFHQNIPYHFCCESAVNSAAYVAIRNNQKNVVYLSLSDTVGGAIWMNGKQYSGNNYRAAGFGHVIIEPRGRKCACGREGCLDAYCSVQALTGGSGALDQFFAELEAEEPQAEQRWDEYLDYLSLFLANIRMQYDCDIILGGDVGRYMSGHIRRLEKKIYEHSSFDFDATCLSIDDSIPESAAVGAAKCMIDEYIANLEMPERV